MLHELAAATGKRIVFYCAFGERSAMAVQAAQDAGLKTACHIQGGIDAWKKANGPLARRAWPDESQASLTPNKSMTTAR
jgi:rhodanese-related sulfurtransferase